MASAATALPSPGVECSSASAGAPRPIAWPAAIPTAEPSCSASTKRRSSGRPARNGTSVEPGFENSVVSPRRAQDVERGVAHGVLVATAGTLLQNVWPFAHPVACLAHVDGTRHAPEASWLRSPTGASEQIAAQIRRWLEQQQLQPGDRIGTEQELADEFGVSRPTMREALRLLSASHLVRVGRGRTGGIFVARTPSEGMGRNLSASRSR